MSKKIYDVMPPKVAHKVENTIKFLDAKDKRKRKPVKAVQSFKEPVAPPKRRFPLREILVGGAIIVILLAVYFYNTLPSADIQISPTLDTVSLQDKITADKSVNVIDALKKVIPATFIEEKKEATQQFLATGSASDNGKASGTITIYNKISPSTPLGLKAGTHFLSDSGKYFVTLTKVTVPAMQGKTSGSVQVKVQAEEFSADYNIGPSKFSVPKLFGTSYYYGIWAESTSSMRGGYTGKVKKITKDDIDSAKDVLTKKLLQDVEDSLRRKVSQDDVLLEGAISKSVVSVLADQKQDTIQDTFNETADVKGSALLVKKSDLETLIKNEILSQLPPDKNLLENSLNVTYTPDVISVNNGTEKINLGASAKTYYTIEESDLTDLFSRESASQIKDIVNSKYGDKVSEVKISFWPFWVHKAPKNKNRIKISLHFE